MPMNGCAQMHLKSIYNKSPTLLANKLGHLNRQGIRKKKHLCNIV
jgi:hypothetical protein